MTKEEYMECRFIRDGMRFYTRKDFWKDKWAIKKLYKGLKYKTMYKWYVYSHCNISVMDLDAIWEFLNDPLFLIKNSENCVDNKKDL